MSANTRKTCLPVIRCCQRIFAASWLSAIATAAPAAEPGDMFPTRMIDPLHAQPVSGERGIGMWGNLAAPLCPQRADTRNILGLSDVVDMALCHSPKIRETWAAIKLQVAAVGEARSAYLPTVSATMSRQHTETTYPDLNAVTSTVSGTGLYGTLNWRLFDFGTRAANAQAANSLLVAALSAQDAALQVLLAAVVQAFFDAETARGLWLAKVRGESLGEQVLSSTKRREMNGTAARMDTLMATTALAKARLEKSRAHGAYRKALSTLVYVMGMPTGSEIVLPEESGDLNADVDQDSDRSIGAAKRELDDWLAEAQRSHPAILAARAQLKAAQSKVTSTRAEGLPVVDFSANLYRNGYPGQALSSTRTHVETFGLSVTFPIFTGYSQTYKIRQAQAMADQREAELLDIEHSTLMEVVKTHADALSSFDNLKESQILLQAAREAQATSMRRYERGAADILEILNTQGALVDAQQERVRSIGDWRSARLRLMASTGSLGILAIGAASVRR